MSRKQSGQQKDKRINQVASRNAASNLYENLGHMFVDLQRLHLMHNSIMTLDQTEQWSGLADALSEEMKKEAV